MYSKSGKYLEILKNLKYLLTIFKFQNKFFYSEISYLRRNLKNLNNNYKDYYLKFENSNLNNFLENEDVNNLISSLFISKDVLGFIRNKEEDQLRTLIEFVDDVGDSLIKVDTVKDLLIFHTFFHLIETAIKESKYLEFLYKIEAIINQEKFRHITAYIANVTANIIGLQDLYNRVANREEYDKKKIKSIKTFSKFEINNVGSSSEYSFTVVYCDKQLVSQTKLCGMEEVKELRDRSLFLSKKKHFQHPLMACSRSVMAWSRLAMARLHIRIYY